LIRALTGIEVRLVDESVTSQPELPFEAVPAERWLPVPGYEGLYAVSDLGRVRSFHAGRGKGKRGGLLKPGLSSTGKLTVVLYRDGKGRSRPVHSLVLEAFVSPRPPGKEGCHGPGRELDNRLVNLRWGTSKENSEDQERDGTVARGEKHGQAKLTEAIVAECRGRYAGGEQIIALAREFGVNKGTLGDAVTGRRWQHASSIPVVLEPQECYSRRGWRGEGHGEAKLTEAIVAECRARYAGGTSQRVLADEFGVSKAAIQRAVTGKTWRMVPMMATA
jgi:NUMOD4 motif